jgi:hypothetical protein
MTIPKSKAGPHANGKSGPITLRRPWVEQSPELAVHFEKHWLNRTDCFGRYYVAEDGKFSQATAKTSLTQKILLAHFRANDTPDVIGAHTTVFQPVEGHVEGGKSLSRWPCIDIDHHGDGQPPPSLFHASVAWYEALVRRGFHPLLVDSNGSGGFKLYVLFSEPVLTARVRRLALGLTSDWATYGLPSQPECFPKQDKITAPGSKEGSYGNWVRLPGRHYKRDHWTGVWNGSDFVYGKPAIDLILAYTGDSPLLLCDEGDYGRGALLNEIAQGDAISEGHRHDFLRESALRLASLEKRGDLTSSEVAAGVKAMARGNGLEAAGRSAEVEKLLETARQRANCRKPAEGSKHPSPSPNGKAKTGQGGGKQPETRIDYDTMNEADLGIRRAAGIRILPIKFLLPERIPERDYTLVAGRGKQGKSQWTMAFGAKLSTGGKWWDESGDPERIIVPRLTALGANLENVTILEAKYKIPSADGRSKLVAFASMQSLDYWRAVFGRIKNPIALVIDPLPSYMGSGVNDRRNNDVRAILGPFIDLVKEFEMTLVGVTHFGKSIDARNAADKILDSIAYVNLARATHFISKDPDNPGRVLFMPGPCNYTRADIPSIAFTIVEKTIPDGEGGEITVAVPEFAIETVEADPDDVVNRQAKSKCGSRGPDPSSTPKLALWLIDFLKSKGPVFLGEIADAAGQAGFLGTQRWNPEKNHQEWSSFTAIYRAADAVEKLPAPDDGWEVVTSKKDPALRSITGKARWAIRKAGSPY